MSLNAVRRRGTAVGLCHSEQRTCWI